jgi:glucokinase
MSAMTSNCSGQRGTDAQRALGIDIGATTTKLAVVRKDGTVEHSRTLPTRPEVDGLPFGNRLLGEARAVMGSCEAEGWPVAGIGASVAGFVDPDHTRMTFNSGLPWLEGYDLRQALAEGTGLPVTLEIDSNAAALAEAVLGAGQSSRRLLVLAIGTGLGGGMTVDGRLLRIANECLGDIGHVVVEPGGPACASGCRGCAEAMTSAGRLVEYWLEARRAGRPSSIATDVAGGVGARQVIEGARAGDGAAVEAIGRLAHYLGIAIASMVPVLAPDMVLLAGGIAEAGPALLRGTEASLRGVCGPVYHAGLRLDLARFGSRAGLVGAALPWLVA